MTQKRRSGHGRDQEQGRAKDCDEPEAVDEGGLGGLDEVGRVCWGETRRLGECVANGLGVRTRAGSSGTINTAGEASEHCDAQGAPEIGHRLKSCAGYPGPFSRHRSDAQLSRDLIDRCETDGVDDTAEHEHEQPGDGADCSDDREAHSRNGEPAASRRPRPILDPSRGAISPPRAYAAALGMVHKPASSGDMP